MAIDLFSKVWVVVIAMVIHPIVMTRTLYHCARTGHYYDMECFNFNYNIRCHHCDREFIHEAEEDDLED